MWIEDRVVDVQELQMQESIAILTATFVRRNRNITVPAVKHILDELMVG